ncbi:hypothetical protein EMCRGX_G018094 [Ephydatia muelleri]
MLNLVDGCLSPSKRWTIGLAPNPCLENDGNWNLAYPYLSVPAAKQGPESEPVSKFPRVKTWFREKAKSTKSFPLSVFFIVGNEFCERFSYYGMKAVLILFLTSQLKFSADNSTAIYHTFVMFCYFLPLVGAIIADSCLGKYGTILSLSIIYSVGNVIMAVSAITFGNGDAAPNIALAAIGLIVIAFGTGGIKPCVASFGGDQFKEDQVGMLQYFFSIFYFSINAGSTISTLVTPVLRNDVKCFGNDQCFPLAFGVPAILMIVSVIIFVVGTRFYIVKKPNKESALLFYHFVASIVVATYHRIKRGKDATCTFFLQHAKPNYEDSFLRDVKMVLRVLVMFLPLPIFWALFDQQGSRWTLQAVKMNGRLGSITITPDQMQALNPILILAFIPIFQFVVYPLFNKCHLLRRPLQRMVVGMGIAGLAFVVAGFVELKIEADADLLNTGQSKVVLTNTIENPITVISSDFNGTLDRLATYSFQPKQLVQYQFDFKLEGTEPRSCFFDLQSQNITEIVVTNASGLIECGSVTHVQDSKTSELSAIVRVFNVINNNSDIALMVVDSKNVSENLRFLDASDVFTVATGRTLPYSIIVNHNGSLIYNNGYLDEFGENGVYSLVIKNSSIVVAPVDKPNSVSLFLQVPMYIIITVAEVMFSINGLEFAYSQAPASMKAICQAAWLWTVAFGNLVVVIIAESKLFESQAIEFFFLCCCNWFCDRDFCCDDILL